MSLLTKFIEAPNGDNNSIDLKAYQDHFQRNLNPKFKMHLFRNIKQTYFF